MKYPHSESRKQVQGNVYVFQNARLVRVGSTFGKLNILFLKIITLKSFIKIFGSIMITSKHLKIYKNYGGDGDMLIRTGSNEEKELMNYETWSLIEELIQNLELVEKELTSDNFKFQTLNKLKEVCGDERTQQELKSLIGKY